MSPPLPPAALLGLLLSSVTRRSLTYGACGGLRGCITAALLKPDSTPIWLKSVIFELAFEVIGCFIMCICSLWESVRLLKGVGGIKFKF